ncbi:hypothetical protein MGG_17305 [Pyricularia oryzae 70-15]|uniref:Uncharacterized protein n=1 Tax=Pyricularia oryzae (strain 70-15 / ATCC MYA-4617 / FGSC 8958) TaxID=242507 RepID=G4NBM8_PYRO7|nr:uncharacterized protein MGG_17305 [Pyricularia oryzae 70-15]EHA48133.1 hypothetical protein MGG_17305 [Pyricularia oryzae 70-15]
MVSFWVTLLSRSSLNLRLDSIFMPLEPVTGGTQNKLPPINRVFSTAPTSASQNHKRMIGGGLLGQKRQHLRRLTAWCKQIPHTWGLGVAATANNNTLRIFG